MRKKSKCQQISPRVTKMKFIVQSFNVSYSIPNKLNVHECAEEQKIIGLRNTVTTNYVTKTSTASTY